MTIKKQIDSGRKVIKLSATFFALVLVLIACKKEETGIGADLQNGNLNVIVQDTFTIKTYSEDDSAGYFYNQNLFRGDC